MRLVLALFALLFAVPASAATFYFDATTTSVIDNIGQPDVPGIPPYQEFEEGTFFLTVTLVDDETYACDLEGTNCAVGFINTYSFVDGMFEGVTSDFSTSSSLSFAQGIGLLSVTSEFIGSAQNFREIEFSLAQVPLPASGLLLLIAAMPLFRFRLRA